MATQSLNLAVKHAERFSGEEQDRLASVLDKEAMRLSVRQGIDDADSGRTVSHEAVEEWFESLGTGSELPKPTCK
jgi:predicted transcriptional regulator